jgi:hypothetical protein
MRCGSPWLDGCTLRQKRQDPSISAGPGRKSSSRGSLERATTPGGREPALRVGRARARRRQWETSRAALRSGTPHQRDAQPDRAAHVSKTRRLRRLPSGPPHRVAYLDRDERATGFGGDRTCSRRSLLRPPPLPRSPCLHRSPCRPSREERASFTRPGVIPPAVAPVRCEEETRPVSSAAPAPISSGDIRATLP